MNALRAQISLAPPENTRLIALAAVEAFLTVIGDSTNAQRITQFMPALGQILSLDRLGTILPYVADGKAATRLPPPPATSMLPLAGGSSSSGGASPSPSGSQ